jgi:hypothetical protein
MSLVRRALALVLAVFVIGAVVVSASPAQAAGPPTLGVSGWQVLASTAIYPNQGSQSVHGHPTQYATAPAIAAQNDPGWANCGPSSPVRFAQNYSAPLCPNASTIGMAVGSILSGCWSNLNFTYFQALVSIPENTIVTSFSVNMSGADDGARISLVNSQNSNGVTPADGFIYQGTQQATGNLASFVVAGEVNRVVITQVDDCAVGNNLNSAQILLNGTVVPPAPAADFSLAAAPASGAVTAGSSTATTINVAGIGAFSSGVNLSVSGLPAGTTAAFQPPTVNAGQFSTLSLQTSIGTPPGTYPLTVTGTSGAIVHTTPYSLTVNPKIVRATFSQGPATAGPADACICTPLLMNNEVFNGTSSQEWYVKASSNSVDIDVAAVSVNGSEQGSIVATAYDGATVLGSVTVIHPSVTGTEANAHLVFPATSGTVYRLVIEAKPGPGTLVARHYRLKIRGASQAGFDSPGIQNLEGGDASWGLNVNAGENLDVTIGTGNVSGPGDPVQYLLVRPDGTHGAPVSTTLPATISVPSAAVGQWTLMLGADHHYTVSKNTGSDRGVYATWLTSGKGSLGITTTRGGFPSTLPVAVTVTNVLTGEAIPFPNVLGSLPPVNLPVGVYDITAAAPPGQTYQVVPGVVRVSITCDGAGAVSFDVINRAPTVQVNGPGSLPEGSSVGIGSLAADPDGDPVSLSWSVSGPATLATSGNPRQLTVGDGPGQVEVTVVATDSLGASSTASIVIDIVNVAPTATPIAPADVDEGDGITVSLIDPHDPSAADRAAGFTYAFACDGGDVGAFGPDNAITCGTTDNGLRSIRLAIRDKDGGVSEYLVSVNVLNVAPVAAAGADQTVYRNQVVNLAGNWTDPGGAFDNPYAWTWAANTASAGTAPYGTTVSRTATYGLEGVYTASFGVTDKDGASDVDHATITVLNRAPVCTAAAPSISRIWPPNHQMVAVSILGLTDAEGDALTVKVTAIRQDEPTNTVGDGNTPIDGSGVGTARALVRAERTGTPRVPGNGRVYHISFTVSDGHGGSCSGVVRVGVPHDQRGAGPVDGGPLYDSTI